MTAKFIWHQLRRINKLPGARSLFYWLASLAYPDGRIVTIRRGPAAGYRWRHYRCYQPWMTLGLYEPDVAQLVARLLHPGDVFYDIGANAGYYVLVAARSVGPAGQVIAFDPVPKNVRTIQEQIHLNNLQATCSVEPWAISDANGAADFLISARNPNSHLAHVPAPHALDKRGELIQAQCVTLDSYTSSHPWPALIKMDIEGAEVKALQGAARLLTGPSLPVFLITAHSAELEHQVKAILQQAGYMFSDFPHMIHATPHAREP